MLPAHTLLWLLLAAMLILPVVLRVCAGEEEEPGSTVIHDSRDDPGEDRDGGDIKLAA